jgi:hypothetical protein
MLPLAPRCATLTDALAILSVFAAVASLILAAEWWRGGWAVVVAKGPSLAGWVGLVGVVVGGAYGLDRLLCR